MLFGCCLDVGWGRGGGLRNSRHWCPEAAEAQYAVSPEDTDNIQAYKLDISFSGRLPPYTLSADSTVPRSISPSEPLPPVLSGSRKPSSMESIGESDAETE